MIGHAEQLVDGKPLRAAIDGDPIEPPDQNGVARGCARVLADQDFGSVAFVDRFEAARDIDGIADHRVAQPLIGADIADQHSPGIDADAHAQRHPSVAARLGAALTQAASEFERRGTSIDRMPIVRRRRAPERHHRIADELVDGSVAR